MFPRFIPSLLSSVERTGRAGALAASLALALGATSVRAQTTASPAAPAGPGRVRMAKSFLEVAPAGKATAIVRAENVRDTLTAAEAGAPMRIRLALRMRNADELQRRVAAGEIIPREEMAARFLPEVKDHQVVAEWLASQGLTVTPAGASHALVMASGTPAQLEKAFETHFARVQYQGEEYSSATVAPSVPAEIRARVSSVHGLQPHLHPRKLSTPVTDYVDPGDFVYGTPPYYVNEISKAYGIAPTGLTGAGQTIAIVIDLPPLNSDLSTFYANNALPQTTSNVTVVSVENDDNFRLLLPEGEETLDTEWSSGLAVGARVVVYGTGSLGNINDAYGRVLDDLQSGAQPGLHQLSMSFGAGEVTGETPDDVNSTHDMFAAIAAYGVTLFASAGDNGAYGNDAAQKQVEVLYPASDPLVTAVGGTTLTLSVAQTVATQSFVSEYGWTFVDDNRNNGSGAGGGGYSIYFPKPAYQVGKGVDPDGMRQVPDVAFAGDPDTGAYLVLQSKVQDIGGTSWSSPCWAAMCALVNQARAERGKQPLTSLNSSLYPLLGTTAFRDILYGDNGEYGCTAGYDLVTGLGVPNFTVLSQKLATSNQTTFFQGQTALSNGVYYLQFSDGNYFGYYSYLPDPEYIYHFDLGYEFVTNAYDNKAGIYLYDFASGDYFYTSPTFPFPYLYDFTLNTTLYYYPDPNNPGHYNTDGIRYFYDFATGKIIQR